MQAIAVQPSARTLELIEIDEPRLTSPTSVKLRMLDVGVCGTDREICQFDYGTPPAGSQHLVIGHESLGEVVEVGSGVSHVKPGDLVVPGVRRPCSRPDCKACRAGRQDFCFTGEFTERGINGMHGYMTEFVVDDERLMHKLPASLRDTGVLVEPLTIAEKALIQVRLIQERLPWACELVPGRASQSCHTALVLGAGPVGLLGAMALVNAGFDTYVYSREEEPNPKAELVKGIGAHYVSSVMVPVNQLPELMGNIDVVYEAVGASTLAFEVMGVLGTNGIFVFTGVPGRRGPTEVDTDALMRSLVLKNQLVLGSVNAGHDAFENSIADLTVFMERWPAQVRALITGRFPMDAHRDLLLGKPGGIKNVLAIGARN